MHFWNKPQTYRYNQCATKFAEMKPCRNKINPSCMTSSSPNLVIKEIDHSENPRYKYPYPSKECTFKVILNNTPEKNCPLTYPKITETYIYGIKFHRQ